MTKSDRCGIALAAVSVNGFLSPVLPLQEAAWNVQEFTNGSEEMLVFTITSNSSSTAESTSNSSSTVERTDEDKDITNDAYRQMRDRCSKGGVQNVGPDFLAALSELESRGTILIPNKEAYQSHTVCPTCVQMTGQAASVENYKLCNVHAHAGTARLNHSLSGFCTKGTAAPREAFLPHPTSRPTFEYCVHAPEQTGEAIVYANQVRKLFAVRDGVRPDPIAYGSMDLNFHGIRLNCALRNRSLNVTLRYDNNIVGCPSSFVLPEWPSLPDRTRSVVPVPWDSWWEDFLIDLSAYDVDRASQARLSYLVLAMIHQSLQEGFNPYKTYRVVPVPESPIAHEGEVSVRFDFEKRTLEIDQGNMRRYSLPALLFYAQRDPQKEALQCTNCLVRKLVAVGMASVCAFVLIAAYLKGPADDTTTVVIPRKSSSSSSSRRRKAVR